MIARIPRARARLAATQDKTGEMMKELLRATAAPAAALVAAVAFGAMLAPTNASAGEFCRQDVTGHMTGCGYDSMEQCKAAAAGIGGDCFRDPWRDTNQTANNGTANAGRSSYAYQPRTSRAEHGRRRQGTPASSNN